MVEKLKLGGIFGDFYFILALVCCFVLFFILFIYLFFCLQQTKLNVILRELENPQGKYSFNKSGKIKTKFRPKNRKQQQNLRTLIFSIALLKEILNTEKNTISRKLKFRKDWRIIQRGNIWINLNKWKYTTITGICYAN